MVGLEGRRVQAPCPVWLPKAGSECPTQASEVSISPKQKP